MFAYSGCALFNTNTGTLNLPDQSQNASYAPDKYYTILINAYLSIILSTDVTHKFTHAVTMVVWWSECVLLYAPAWWKNYKVCHGHPRFCGRTREHSEYGGILHDQR